MAKTMKFMVHGDCYSAPASMTVSLKGVSAPMVWNVVDEAIHSRARKLRCRVAAINHAGRTVTLKER